MIVYNGATGGLGRYVGPALTKSDVGHAALATRIERHRDLGDELESLDLEPETDVALIHLAAMVSVPRCEAEPAVARAVNVEGAAAYVGRFLEWSRARRMRPGIVYVSTGHVYSPLENEMPVSEDAPVDPRSVYAMSKLQGEQAVGHVAADAGVAMTVARVFGLVAPAQPSHYVLPSFIERARHGVVTDVPGLGNVRDYLDSRDVARHLGALARWTVHDSDGFAIVNVCSGIGTPLRTLLDLVIDAVWGRGTERGEALRSAVTSAPGRATDMRWLVGSPSRLIRCTGEAVQTITLEATVRDAVAAG